MHYLERPHKIRSTKMYVCDVVLDGMVCKFSTQSTATTLRSCAMRRGFLGWQPFVHLVPRRGI